MVGSLVLALVVIALVAWGGRRALSHNGPRVSDGASIRRFFTYAALFGLGSEPVPGSGFSFSRPAQPAAVPGYGAPDQYQQEWNQENPAVQAEAQAAQAQAAQGQQAHPWGTEPIIQDGWQWDPYAQQWVPAQQQQPPPAEGGDQTQIRPPGQ